MCNLSMIILVVTAKFVRIIYTITGGFNWSFF